MEDGVGEEEVKSAAEDGRGRWSRGLHWKQCHAKLRKKLIAKQEEFSIEYGRY